MESTPAFQIMLGMFSMHIDFKVLLTSLRKVSIFKEKKLRY